MKKFAFALTIVILMALASMSGLFAPAEQPAQVTQQPVPTTTSHPSTDTL